MIPTSSRTLSAACCVQTNLGSYSFLSLCYLLMGGGTNSAVVGGYSQLCAQRGTCSSAQQAVGPGVRPKFSGMQGVLESQFSLSGPLLLVIILVLLSPCIFLTSSYSWLGHCHTKCRQFTGLVFLFQYHLCPS